MNLGIGIKRYLNVFKSLNASLKESNHFKAFDTRTCVKPTFPQFLPLENRFLRYILIYYYHYFQGRHFSRGEGRADSDPDHLNHLRDRAWLSPAAPLTNGTTCRICLSLVFCYFFFFGFVWFGFVSPSANGRGRLQPSARWVLPEASSGSSRRTLPPRVSSHLISPLTFVQTARRMFCSDETRHRSINPAMTPD